MSRQGLSLIEILVALAVITTLALPFVEMVATTKRKVEGLPRRLCALFYAQDLMEERLSQKRWTSVKSISKRKISDYVWVRDNVYMLAASETGEKRQRLRGSLNFLNLFDAEVVVVDEVPNRRKRVKVVVSWEEGGRDVDVALESVREQ